MTHAFLWTTLPATLAWHSPQPALQGTTASLCSAASGEGAAGASQVFGDNRPLISRVSNLNTWEGTRFPKCRFTFWASPRAQGQQARGLAAAELLHKSRLQEEFPSLSSISLHGFGMWELTPGTGCPAMNRWKR